MTGNVVKENTGSGSSSDVYSTTETLTNKVWIDGKPIYRKVMEISSLPNATNVEFTTDISVAYFTNIYGIAIKKDDTYTRRIIGQPNIYIGYTYRHPALYKMVFNIVTGADFSGYSGKIVLEYTKS